MSEDIEAIEALRDALSFIQAQERGYLNDGSQMARAKAYACEEIVARLYPVYARLTGCDVVPVEANHG